MTFNAAGLLWEGPYRDPLQLEAAGGVYAVLCKTTTEWSVLDIGESGNVAERLSGHDRKLSWFVHAMARGGEVWFAAHYTPGATADGRRRIEHGLRQATNPPCGDR
jgi:hypothetical protein